MSSLKSMPVGYRFHPTDVELVNHYLKWKNQGSDGYVSNIQAIDVCKWEPWEVPAHLGSESVDQEWYFFGRRDPKYEKSTRANRATKHGFWKPTGKDRDIKMGSKKEPIGTKKTLVFHMGRGQNAISTDWVMHEYRATVDKHNPQAFFLYLLKKKSDENLDLPISDGTGQNRSSPPSLVNNAPSHFPSTPTVVQGSEYLFPSDLAYLEDVFDFQAFERDNPNQGPIHMTARYFNVSNNGHGVTQLQNMKEIINEIDNGSSIFMGTPETVPPKTSESKNLNAVSDDSSVESLSEAKSFRVAENESSGRLGGNSHNMGFIVYADNPRVNNGTTPPSDYILNIAIGIFLTAVITGEVLFGLVS